MRSLYSSTERKRYDDNDSHFIAYFITYFFSFVLVENQIIALKVNEASYTKMVLI